MMSVSNRSNYRISDLVEAIVGGSISVGLNIRKQLPEKTQDSGDSSSRNEVKMEYGYYRSGDSSIGGGDPISSDRWIAEP
jgi:hypothetical protein